MSSDSCVFLLVLPELTFLILINLTLIFALLFSHFEPKTTRSSATDFKLSGVETKFDSAYHGFVVTPLLQADAVGKLSVLIFVHDALIYLNSHQVWTSGFGLTGDDLGRFMSVFLCFSASCALSLSLQSLKRFSRYEFTLLLSLSLLGMLCLIKSSSFLSFYLSIELQSLSFYMLAAMRSRTESSSEAGLKYFILSAFSSAMLLLGMAVCYGAIGSQNFSDLTHALNHFSGAPGTLEANLWVGCGCIAVSLLFKLGAAPFHAWIADVYEGSHTSITAWFAITAKIAVATALIRLNGCGMLFNLLTFVAVASLVVGSLSAMRQVKLKRLIAFSAVANAGWFVLALVTGQWQLMVVHLLVYTLQSINLFSVFTLPLFRSHPSLAYRTRSANLSSVSADSVDHGADSSSLKYLSDLHQIVKVNPSLALAVSLSMFSLAGMPPLAGFYSKYLILSAVTQAEMYGVLSLALAVAILSAFYYLRVVKTAYFSGSENASYGGQWWFTLREQPINAWITSFTTATSLLFFLNPDYFCALLFLVN